MQRFMYVAAPRPRHELILANHQTFGLGKGLEMKTPKQARKETPKRLTPKPEVLRELYLLSGNNCAMPNCKNVIIDSMGVVVGHICHIEAAMPDGPRFNADMSNNGRRALSNLVLMCAGHHLQIDSKKYEAKWPVAAVRKLKADHEARFKGLDGSLEQRFRSEFVDSTASLDPSEPKTYKRLEQLVPECKLAEEDAAKRAKQVKAFLKKARLVPQTERDFMLNVINRRSGSVVVPKVQSWSMSTISGARSGSAQPSSKTLAQWVTKLGAGRRPVGQRSLPGNLERTVEIAATLLHPLPMAP
jgi:hypothetical protein